MPLLSLAGTALLQSCSFSSEHQVKGGRRIEQVKGQTAEISQTHLSCLQDPTTQTDKTQIPVQPRLCSNVENISA